uniref:Deoxyribonuclease-2-alpha n=1 Tax=Sphenodon punctatus TaxID=8508 RepID=A0A8D0H6M6_SPHPU
MLLLVLLLLTLAPGVASGGISCYDDSGKPVDWFIAYKLPRPRHSPEAEGMKYMYQDASTQGWVEGNALMNDTKSAVGRTLQQLYTNKRNGNTAYVLYNDAPPSAGFYTIAGHTKGVLLLDQAQGFWLLHSTPHYPPSPKERGYEWPHSGLRNGQSFLCVTFPYNQFKDIGEHLLYTHPRVYESQLEGPFAQDLPALVNVSAGRHVRRPPWNHSAHLTSLGGKTFVSFGKYNSFHDDLYSGWLAQALSSDLYVQFWPNSRGVLPSNCSGRYHVYNIEDVAFPPPGPSFSATEDHSKWCVGGDDTASWACVGDMNRNQEEEQRGGGVLCMQDPAVWKSFHVLVQNYSECDGGRGEKSKPFPEL